MCMNITHYTGLWFEDHTHFEYESVNLEIDLCEYCSRTNGLCGLVVRTFVTRYGIRVRGLWGSQVWILSETIFHTTFGRTKVQVISKFIVNFHLYQGRKRSKINMFSDSIAKNCLTIKAHCYRRSKNWCFLIHRLWRNQKSIKTADLSQDYAKWPELDISIWSYWPADQNW